MEMKSKKNIETNRFLSRFSLVKPCLLRPGELAKLRSGMSRFFVLVVFVMFSVKIRKV